MDKPLALIVKDDVDVGQRLAGTLIDAGFVPLVARTGEEALAHLASTIPALVLVDLHLPDVSGVELLRHIRADARLAEVEVIVTGAHSPAARLGLGAGNEQK